MKRLTHPSLPATLVATIAFLALSPRPPAGAWPEDPTVNLPVCTAPGSQTEIAITGDGVGGVILAWTDARNPGQTDIYARRISVSGDTLWSAHGTAVCRAPGNQDQPTLATDGKGGAIILWRDRRGSSADIYAQRIDADGAVQWSTDGVTVCVAIGNQSTPQAVSDAAGGVWVVWRDERNDGGDIYIQHVDPDGSSLEAEDGLAMSIAANVQSAPQICTDRDGGAFVAWQDLRDDDEADIYARRVRFPGELLPAPGAYPVCSVPGFQQLPRIVSDLRNGAILAWQDFRDGNSDIYAERIGPGGLPTWPTANGTPVCTENGPQESPYLAPDAAGGAYVTWVDLRGAPSTELYAQRIGSGGARQWAEAGIAIATVSNAPALPRVERDGNDGAILLWVDSRPPRSLRAQRIDSEGNLGFDPAGEPVTTAAGSPRAPTLMYRGAGECVVAWEDLRNDLNGITSDVYAHQISRGVIASVSDAELDLPARLHRPVPNPMRTTTRFDFYLPEAAFVRLGVYDRTGRRIRLLVEGRYEPGDHRVRWDGRDYAGRLVLADQYEVRLEADRQVEVRRLDVIR